MPIAHTLRGRAVAKALLPPAAAGRKDEARTPRAPAKGFALCTPISKRRLPDLATALRSEANSACLDVLFWRGSS